MQPPFRSTTCIAVGACNGFAHAADTLATQAMINSLLAQPTAQVVNGFPGPAFVVGDFNQTPGTLAETIKWEQKGWRDVQSWANGQWGILPGPTCCQVSRKDFVSISPALQHLVVSCSNSIDKFPDHSTLMGLLRFPTKPEPVPRWYRPQPIAYEEVSANTIYIYITSTPCFPAEYHADPTEQFAAICQAFEDHVRLQHHSPGLQPQQRGRGQTMHRTFRKDHSSSSQTRSTGRCSSYSERLWSLTHCRWLPQSRRLDHFVKGSTHPVAVEHRASCWRQGFMALSMGQARSIESACSPGCARRPLPSQQCTSRARFASSLRDLRNSSSPREFPPRVPPGLRM